MAGISNRTAPPLPWPGCRTRGPITTQLVQVLSVTPMPNRLVRLRLGLDPNRSMTVIVPDMVRGLRVAESACRTEASVWMTAVVAGDRWVPVLFSGDRGGRS